MPQELHVKLGRQFKTGFNEEFHEQLVVVEESEPGFLNIQHHASVLFVGNLLRSKPVHVGERQFRQEDMYSIPENPALVFKLTFCLIEHEIDLLGKDVVVFVTAQWPIQSSRNETDLLRAPQVQVIYNHESVFILGNFVIDILARHYFEDLARYHAV